jgi:hypothetical protein
MASALTELPTDVLQKQAAIFGAILKITAAVFVAFAALMVWLVLTRGWENRFLVSITPAIAMIAVSAPAMSRLASIKLELERRQGAR